MGNSISVIIPTKDRVGSLRRCIVSLLQQTRLPDEIIVIDDGGNKSAADILSTFRNDRIHVYQPEFALGKSGARNEGIRHAQGEILAFIDDDCTAETSWLAELTRPFLELSIDFVIGQTFYVSREYCAHYPERIVSNVGAKYPMTGNIAFRRGVFDRCGFFDATFDDVGKEDAEFGIRAVSKGCLYKRAPGAVVLHEKSMWTVRGLLSSIRNSSVWPRMKVLYPNHFRAFDPPIIGIFVQPAEYLELLFFPFLVIPLLLLYVKRGNRNLFLFFAKWPIFFICKRLSIWYNAIRYKTLIL